MLDYLRVVLATRLPERLERGATAVEYAMLVAMVGIVIGSIWGLGDILGAVFSAEDSKLRDCTGCSAP